MSSDEHPADDAPDPTDESTPAGPPRRVALLTVAAGVVLALDIVTKVFVVANLEGQPPVRLAGGALYLDVIRNPGAAFSLATGMTWLLTLIAIGVVAAIVRMAGRLRSVGWALGLGLVLGGALGNLVDRLLRAPGPMSGHVVDFISVFAPYGEVYPVFNVADSAIVTGGVLLVLMGLLNKDYDGSSAGNRHRSPHLRHGEKPASVPRSGIDT